MGGLMLDAALGYAAQGLAVFPLHTWAAGACSCGQEGCKSPGKHPRTPRGCLDASTDAAQVRRWWSRWPDAAIGIATGAPSGGLIVLDVDLSPPRGGISGPRALEALPLLPLTRSTTTGSGGRHFWLRQPEGVELRNAARVLVPWQEGRMVPSGLDIRATGGYVVAPPAPHHSGGVYRHDGAPDTPVAEVPEWLLELLQRRSERPPEVITAALPSPPPPPPSGQEEARHRAWAARILEAEAASIVDAQPGERHRAIYYAALRVGRVLWALDRAQAEAQLLAAAAAAGKGGREAAKTVADGLAKGEESRKYPEDRPYQGRAEERQMVAPAQHELDEATEAVAWEEQPSPAPPPAQPEGPGLPEVQTSHRQPSEVVSDAWRAVLAGCKGPWPVLYQRGGSLVRLVEAETGPQIQQHTPDSLLGVLMRSARWLRLRRAYPGEKSAGPFVAAPAEGVPSQVVRAVASDLPAEVPVLDGIVRAPAFDRAGRLVTTPGYHSGARLALVGPQLDTPRLGVVEAVELLCTTWLGDFPFATDSDRAHAVALLVALVGRRLIAGPVPAFWVDAPASGTGKSLLVDLIGLVATGAPPIPAPWSGQEEERRKKFLAALRGGQPLIAVDNVRGGEIASPALEAILTAWPYYGDRDLGRIGDLSLPTLPVWALTANGAGLNRDMARRVLRIRLDAGVADPAARTGFRLPQIRRWTLQHRGALLGAVISLVEVWLQEGRRYDGPMIGSYEAASVVLGGVLQRAGIEGWASTPATERVDRETEEWTRLLAYWLDTRPAGEALAASDVLALADACEVMGGEGSPMARTRSMGAALKAIVGRTFLVDGQAVRVVGGSVLRGRAVYRLAEV
jgi:hypothetical protein